MLLILAAAAPQAGAAGWAWDGCGVVAARRPEDAIGNLGKGNSPRFFFCFLRGRGIHLGGKLAMS